VYFTFIFLLSFPACHIEKAFMPFQFFHKSFLPRLNRFSGDQDTKDFFFCGHVYMVQGSFGCYPVTIAGFLYLLVKVQLPLFWLASGTESCKVLFVQLSPPFLSPSVPLVSTFDEIISKRFDIVKRF